MFPRRDRKHIEKIRGSIVYASRDSQELGRQAGSQAGMQAGKQAGRQAGRQTKYIASAFEGSQELRNVS